jgi:2-methylcitrate dehydratase PrpD
LVRRDGSKRKSLEVNDGGQGMNKAVFSSGGSREDFSGISRRLADHIVSSRWDDIPAAIREQAVKSIFNGFGTALGGSHDQATIRLLETLEPYSNGSAATVIGHRKKVDLPTAAFLNAVAVNVFDFDDTHDGTIIHPTAPVAAALFAAAEHYPTSGADLLHAFVLGVEVECRIGNAISPGHYDRGWHITATCGIFGAAAAVARLIGLNSREMLWAFGNASAQASGLVETLGSMAKSVGVGNAARNGMLAALMAKHGVEGPNEPLEGKRGFLSVTGENPDFAAILKDFGQSWELSRNMFKPYPCGVVLNPVIDACLSARQQPGFDPERISTITVAGNPLLKARADRPDVTRGREAQVSTQHAVAVALLRGSAGVVDFSDRAVSDPDVLAFRSKITGIDVNPALPVESACLVLHMADGSSQQVQVDIASGSLGKPMTRAELVAKFEALAAFGCPELETAPLMDRLWGIENAPDAAEIVAAARPANERV